MLSYLFVWCWNGRLEVRLLSCIWKGKGKQGESTHLKIRLDGIFLFWNFWDKLSLQNWSGRGDLRVGESGDMKKGWERTMYI